MAVIAKKDGPIASIKDLKGKKVAIWPGSTQEVFILERLRMEGMTIKDISRCASPSARCISRSRAATSTPMSAPSRARACRISTGVGKLVEYPYSTPMGALNMVFGAHRDTLASKPELVSVILEIHRKACEFAMANPAEMVEMAVAKLGQKREAIEVSAAQRRAELEDDARDGSGSRRPMPSTCLSSSRSGRCRTSRPSSTPASSTSWRQA